MDEIFAIYEPIAKLAAYGDDSPTFGLLVQQQLLQSGYRIDRTFDNPQTGFHAIGLFPTVAGRAPLLVFRGTDSLIDDRTLTDPRGVGLLQLEADQLALEGWLQRAQQETGRLADLLGHSLGGGVAQQAAVAFPTLFNQLVTFNAPGIDQSAIDRFMQNGGANRPVTHFIVDGDLVSLVGEGFLPGRVVLLDAFDPIINPTLSLPGTPLDTIPDKHTLQNLLSSPPPGLVTREITTDTLSSPTFTFSGADFQEFIAAFPVAVPTLSTLTLQRQDLEAFRVTPGTSFFGFVNLVGTGLAFDRNNLLVGTDRNDQSLALEGNDTLRGNGGDDFLNGNRGEDRVEGGSGNDTLFGGKERDILLGGGGNDFISGDLGNDTLFGGSGNDQFVLGPGRGEDRIEDFILGEDRILLSGISFNQVDIFPGDNQTTVLRVSITGETLATLIGVSIGAITTPSNLFA